MKIQTSSEEGHAIVRLSGRLAIGVGDVALRAEVADLLEKGINRIVVDLAGVTTMDSSGLGEMVSSHTAVSNRGGKLVLADLPPKVTDILQVTQLLTVFEVYDTASEAVRSFR